jgi:hypothetical protein
VAQPYLAEAFSFNLAVSDPKYFRELTGSGLVCGGTVLPGIAFDSCHGTDVSRQAGRVQERMSRARQVLNAKKHLKFLGRSGHDYRLRLAFARLQCNSGVALIPCQ